MTEKIISHLFSSVDATTNSVNNDEFSVSLDNPIHVPVDTKSCQIGCYSAKIWNSSPNIITGVNDKIYYTVGVDPQTSMTIPQGLYSFSQLNSRISVELQQAGYDSQTFQLLGDEATQFVYVLYKVGVRLDFTQANTCRVLLGFNSRLAPLAGVSTEGQIEFADSIANFNTYNSFLVQSSLVRDGVPLNDKGSNVIVQVPLLASANRLISYNPSQILWIQSDHLRGHPISQVNFKVLSDSLGSLIMPENWSLIVLIKYTL